MGPPSSVVYPSLISARDFSEIIAETLLRKVNLANFLLPSDPITKCHLSLLPYDLAILPNTGTTIEIINKKYYEEHVCTEL